MGARLRPTAPDPERFRTEILPLLGRVSTREIAAATGLSRNFAATIKSAKHVPHAMHWDLLRGVMPASRR